MTTHVTVIGLGPMGQAMTRTLLRAGHPVTVWNRTPSRGDGVVAAGATRAVTPAHAVRAGDLVILSLTDYQAMYDVLGDATETLAGRTLVNLSSDTPDRTREAFAWARRHGADFLTGGVMVPGPIIGTEAAYVYYSGPAQVMNRHRETLSRIGEPRYLGDDPGLAQLMYQAHLDVFLTTLSALMHATALLGTAGMQAREVVPELLNTVARTPEMVNADETPLGNRVDADHHSGDQVATATMMGATAGHILAASEAAGIDLTLPRAVKGHYERALDDGYGRDSWTRIIEGIRRPAG